MRRVLVLPHTHWDREWYEPHESFRSRLVGVVGEVLSTLEADPSFAGFHLDGQTAVVDDHLAIVPGDEARIRALVAAGRLTTGPWAVLADSFLPSGETLARNLERGLARAAELGGAVAVGWLPDSFGHCAQLPQLLARAGIRHAVVWRGVPAVVDRTAFLWVAPDGSAVRAEVLTAGYDAGGHVPAEPAELAARVADHLADLGDRLVGDLVWPQGGDHHRIQPRLPAALGAASGNGSGLRFEIGTPAALVARDPDDAELVPYAGELRSGARANLLAGVTSTRVDVKAAAAAAEVALERIAGPLASLHLPRTDPAHALLERAWDLVVANAAHDSICACSADATVAEVLVRYRSALALAEGAARRALDAVARRVPSGRVVVVNTVARSRSGVVELDLPGEGEVEGAQVVEARAADLLDVTVPAGVLAPLLERIRSQQVNDTTWVVGVEIDDSGDVIDITAQCAALPSARLDIGALRARAEQLIAADPQRLVRLRAVQTPTRRVAVRVGPIPGYGLTSWLPAPVDVEPVTVDGTTISNGLVTVDVDERRGTMSVDGIRGFGGIVEDGEAGDTYTHEDVDADEPVTAPEGVRVAVEEVGPIRARLRIETAWRWRGAPASVETSVEMRAGERLVRLTHRFVNPCGGHRVRAVVPLARPVTVVDAGCAFAVVERSRWSEGGIEAPCPTAPARRFVRGGDVSIVVPGVVEYELAEAGDAIFLTLLRSIGVLSRPALPSRPVNAGPALPVPDAQLVAREIEFGYGVVFGATTTADALAFADDLATPLQVVEGRGPADVVPPGPALRVDGAEVSSVDRDRVRIWNPSGDRVTAHVDGRAVSLGPWEIAVVARG